MTTRTVHIEIVSSMDTISCVMGIERFFVRRGTPSVIRSDNGTNFVEAEKKLLNCSQSLNAQVPTKLAKKGMNWKLNPCQLRITVDHGVVGCCKRVFHATIGNRKLTSEVLETIFCLVEQ